jgi:predicted dehydrogenase
MKAGYIGTGWTERVQIELFQHAGIEPGAVCSGHKKNAERVAKKFGIPKVYDDWKELLKESEVDLVSSVTPTDLHAPIIRAAIRRGLPIISEGPFLNQQEVQELIDEAEKQPDSFVAIDYDLRFNQRILEIKELLTRRVIGGPQRFKLTYEYNYTDDPWTWANDLSRGGGALNLIGSHFIDLSQWIFGRIATVAATFQIANSNRQLPASKSKKKVTADDRVELTLTFESGVEGSILVDTMAAHDRGISILTEGSSGNLWLSPEEKLWKIDSSRRQIATTSETLPEGIDQNLFTSGTLHLGESIRQAFSNGEGDPTGLPGLKEALANQEIIDTAYETGEWE